MSSTLVTGASGFAGSHLIDRLSGRSPLVAWHRPGTRTAPPGPGIEWRAVDLHDRSAVFQALADARPARIFHVAGAPRVDTAWSSVVPHLQTNVLGTHHLLEGVRHAGLKCRVLVVSSGLVYQTGDQPIDEDGPLVPSSPYGLSKLAQDQLALRAWRDDGLDVVVARPFNHIGPRQDPTFSVPAFARQVALIEAGRAEPVIHVGNLDARRDLTDVRDVAEAYARLMDGGASGRAYNICSGHAVRIGDVLDDLVRMAHVPVRIAIDPARLRPLDTPILVGDASRIRCELGWTPSHTLEQTLHLTLEWWRDQVR